MTDVLMNNYARSTIEFTRGEGMYLWDKQGKRYLDFYAGIAVNGLGHAHPYLVKALQEAAMRPWHVTNGYEIAEQRRLAERLMANSFADQAFFCNSGAEAIEASIKLARLYHYRRGQAQKYRIITFGGAFHGRTLATIAAGGNPQYLEGFGPVVNGFDQVSLGNLNQVREAIGEETAAILIEPVQGEGGAALAAADFLLGLRQAAQDYGLLLIYDEVQCGNGRTGEYWAYQHSGIAPDILATAKGLGGGFPLGAVLATAEVGQSFQPGNHGTTFGGNPLAMAMGNAVLDVMEDPHFLANVRTTSAKLEILLTKLVEDFPDQFKEVRGLGLLRGLVWQESFPVKEQVAALRERGLLTVGGSGNVMRLLPPLIATEEDCRQAVSIIRKLCEDNRVAKAA